MIPLELCLICKQSYEISKARLDFFLCELCFLLFSLSSMRILLNVVLIYHSASFIKWTLTFSALEGDFSLSFSVYLNYAFIKRVAYD